MSGLAQERRFYWVSHKKNYGQRRTLPENPLRNENAMKKMTALKKLGFMTGTGLAMCLNHRVLAQDDHWAGTNTPNGILWNVPANWSEGIVPPSDTNAPFSASSPFGGNVWLDPANGDSVIEIPPGDVETPGVPLFGEENFNTIFGPEFGATLNIHGSLRWDWTMAPYNPDPSVRSTINMYSNSVASTTGASLNLGDGWWPVAEGCYVTMNMYGNAQYSSLGGAGWWWGGHLNVYDTASFLANGYVNMGDSSNPNWSQSDGTRSLVVGGGTLKLPENYINTQFAATPNWITLGMLRAYGKGEDTNDLVITDDGTNTIVTVKPLGGALERVYFQPLLKTNVPTGAFQQLILAGDYPNVTGVYLSSTEPGLDPATFPTPVYTSSDPNVVRVDAHGVATAIAPGSATISATVGAFTSGNTVTINVSDNPPTLAHRYTFNGASGTTVADSVGGANFAATLVGGANLGGGKVTLDGSTGYVQLPVGILGSLDEVTIEAWASFGTQTQPATGIPGASLFSFGYTDLSGDINNGYGGDYIDVELDRGGTPGTQLDFGQGIGGNALPSIIEAGERDAVGTGALDGQNNVQVVAVLHPYAGYQSLYTNGVLAATVTMFNNMSDPVAFAASTYNGGSILNYTLGAQAIFDGATNATENSYIGNSLYTNAPTLKGTVSEFRIYSSALSAAQVQADFALGPAAVVGSNRNVSLAATVSGSNLTLTWPTSSAFVNLVSSPTLGSGAVWTSVANGGMTVVGGNYEVTIPTSGTAQFFALQ